jgi:hypothetical protein
METGEQNLNKQGKKGEEGRLDYWAFSQLKIKL